MKDLEQIKAAIRKEIKNNPTNSEVVIFNVRMGSKIALKHLTPVLEQQQQEIDAAKHADERNSAVIENQRKEIEKLKGLLKEMYWNLMSVNTPFYGMSIEDCPVTNMLNYQWKAYCKEHNINP